MFRHLSFLIVIFLPLFAHAGHTPIGRCDSAGWPAMGIIEITGGEADKTVYVDDRNYLVGNGLWIFAETNGIWTWQGPGIHQGDTTNHNLQRGRSCDICPDDEPPCTDDPLVVPDLLVF